MTTVISNEEQIQELKRKISAIEWDLPNLNNKELKSIKEKELITLKDKITALTNEISLLQNS